jgi:hypothetical protein
MQTIINTQQERIKMIPKEVKTPITTSWIIFLLLLTISIIFYFLFQPEIPLFYTLANKENQLVPKVFVFLFPAISFTINILHFFILRSLQKFSTVLLRLFAGTTIALQILLGFALIRIIIITL